MANSENIRIVAWAQEVASAPAEVYQAAVMSGLPTFKDGFESADVSAWSSTVP